MKRKALIIILMSIALISNLFALDYYDTGSQIFTITVGVDLPFTNTYRDVDNNYVTSYWWGDKGTHFNIGGYGSIDYEVFTNSKLAFGGEIGYLFNRCTDSKLFTQVPLLFKATYVPLQGKFETLISLGLGFNYMSYNDSSMFALTSSLTLGCRYFITDNWAIGLKSGINFTPELYVKSEKNGFHSSIPCSLFASYRH